MPLGIDATIQYRVGSWLPLTARDLRVTGGYNTRTHRGLPHAHLQSGPGFAAGGRAPGQGAVPVLRGDPGRPAPPAPLLAHLRRFRALPEDAPRMTVGGATRVACVIGDPVEHSRSPRMHNAASQALGLDRVYVALRVRRLRSRRAMHGLRAPDSTAPTSPCRTRRRRGAVRRARRRGARRGRGQHTQLCGRPAARRPHGRPRPARGAPRRAGRCRRARRRRQRARRSARRCCARARSDSTIVARRSEAAGALARGLAALAPAAQVDAAGAVRPQAAACSSTARPSAASRNSSSSPCLPM